MIAPQSGIDTANVEVQPEGPRSSTGTGMFARLSAQLKGNSKKEMDIRSPGSVSQAPVRMSLKGERELRSAACPP